MPTRRTPVRDPVGAGPRRLVDEDLPDLMAFLQATVPALATRPFLSGLLTAAITLGLRSVVEYRERVRAHPIVPYAIAHRPTRRELAAYIRRRAELAGLAGDLEAAEAARGEEARRQWDALREAAGAAQADLAAPLAGRRGAVERLDGYLEQLARAGTVELPRSEKRALLALIRERLEADDA